MVKGDSKKLGDLLILANGLVLALVLNQLAAVYFFRADLTEERRYTIKQPTKDLLMSLDDDVFIEVFLEGDLNTGFRRLNKAVRETLEEFRIYSHSKVHYIFTDPATALGQKAQQEFMASLVARGIQPMNVIDTKEGKRTEKIVFPGALVSFGGTEAGVMLLNGNRAQGSEEVLNQSVEGLEFELATAIHSLVNTSRKKIALLYGHGELDSLETASLRAHLLQSYDVFSTELKKNSLRQFDLVFIAKPTLLFSEADKYELDQYLIHGGKVMLLLDRLEASMDSASRENYFAFPYIQGLDDQLFRYGVRVNQDFIQDIVSMQYPVVTGMMNGKPQMTPLEWPFFPLINHYADHIITRNLDMSVLKFVSSIDTVKAPGIRKTPLLLSSVYSRKVTAPVRVNANDVRKEMNRKNFSSGPFALGYLLEGRFTSLYKNRFLPETADSVMFMADGVPAKLIIIGDGDVARNEINRRTGQPQDLGFDPLSGYTFANRDLILNMVAYLSDESGLISVRNKEVKVRPLDKLAITRDRLMWQLVNLILPLLILASGGFLKKYMRRRKYGNFVNPATHS